MSNDLNSFIVLLDGNEEQPLAMPSAISTDQLEAPLQPVYMTSLLLVEPKPATNKRNKIEQIVGDDFKVEDRLQVLNAMLPPPPDRVNKKSKYSENDITRQGLTEDYKCDLCGSQFQTPEQYFGHLRTHSGEHLWECSVCPSGQGVFETLSKLRQHEKSTHICSRPHQCSLCPASYERVSELESHHRRIHKDEKDHVCQLCGKAFYKRSDLRTHLSIHLGLQRRVCEVCGRSFSHVSNLIRHARLHSGVKPYPCTICGRRFTQPTTLDMHRLIHQSDRQNFPCPVGLCSRDFRSRTIAIRHARRLHPETAESIEDSANVKKQQQRKYVCAACGEIFERANLLRLHEAEHDELRCTSCNETFASISDLKAHGCSGLVEVAAEETKELNFLESLEEDTTQNVLQGIPQAEGHAETPLESFLIGSILVCVDNDTMKLKSAQDLSADGILQLTAEDAVTLSATDIEATSSAITSLPFTPEMSSLPELDPSQSSVFFNCSPTSRDNPSPVPPLLLPTPDSTAPLPSPLKLPSRSSSPVLPTHEAKIMIPRLPQGRDSSYVKQRTLTCPQCGKNFRKSSNLKQHMGTHFAEKQLHCCHVCAHTFSWKSSLQKHLLTHFPEMSAAQKASCPDCGKEFSTTALVHEHIRRDHLQERPHSCHLCPKSFYKRHDLVTHIRVHTKERPYMCGVCGKTFTHVSHLKRHELIHRGVKKYACHICNARFRQTAGLKAHLLRHPACSGLGKETQDLNTAAVIQSGES